MADTKTLKSSKDVIIEELKIISPSGKERNISYHYDSIVIYESIYMPVISGEIVITDATNLYSEIGMNGTEFLSIKFKKPGDEFSYSKTFRIYSCVGRQPNKNNQSQIYKLLFCSEEQIFSNQQIISRTFRGGTASRYVVNILRDYLKVNSSKLSIFNFEDSSGTTDFVFTKQKPFDTICELAKYSYGYNGSPFLFYENNAGFNFKSIENLCAQNAINTLNYSSAKYAQDSTDAGGKNSKEMLTFIFDTSFDVLKNTKKSAFAGKLHTLDLVRQKYRTTNHSIVQPSIGRTLLDKKLPIAEARNRNEETLFNAFDTNIKFSLTNLDLTNSEYALSRGYRVNNTNIEKVLMQRDMHIALLNNAVVKCIIAGNPNYTVGFTINFNLPGFTKEENTERMLDAYQSGKYLITSVCHTITKTDGYETSLELSKNSSAAGYEAVTNNEKYRNALTS